MSILLIFRKEIKHIIRNPVNLIMLILFPLVLILILGTAFSGTFDDSSQFKAINVLYSDSNRSKPAAPVFLSHFVKAGTEMGIHFQKAGNLQEGLNSIKKGKFACFIYSGPKGLCLYKNDRLDFQARLVEAALNRSQKRYSLWNAISAINPAAIVNLGRDKPPSIFIQEIALNHQRKPRAIDYYAITMLTMIILYSMYIAVYAVKREQLSHTAGRLLCSPSGNYEILAAKIAATLSMLLLQVLLVITASKILFRVYWGDRPAAVIILFMAEAIMAVSVGTGLAFLIRSHITINGILNISIPVFTLFGGGYMQIEGFTKHFLQLSNLSPLRWINKGLLQVIYAHDFSLLVPAVVINLGIAAIFIGIAAYFARQEAFLK
jgi:ABC-2 type transport system permease protein